MRSLGTAFNKKQEEKSKAGGLLTSLRNKRAIHLLLLLLNPHSRMIWPVPTPLDERDTLHRAPLGGRPGFVLALAGACQFGTAWAGLWPISFINAAASVSSSFLHL